jgi:hypothetical protein
VSSAAAIARRLAPGAQPREPGGEATPAEVKKLKDDGVPCAPLPSLPPDPKKAN